MSLQQARLMGGDGMFGLGDEFVDVAGRRE